jgi:hypothetical protein
VRGWVHRVPCGGVLFVCSIHACGGRLCQSESGFEYEVHPLTVFEFEVDSASTYYALVSSSATIFFYWKINYSNRRPSNQVGSNKYVFLKLSYVTLIKFLEILLTTIISYRYHIKIHFMMYLTMLILYCKC